MILGGAALAVLLLLALLFFRTQVQRNDSLNDVTEVPDRVSAIDTEKTAARTERIEKTVGGSSSTASVVFEPRKLLVDGSSADYLGNEKTNKGQTKPDEIVALPTEKALSESTQVKQPARQSQELKNGQDLARFIPTDDEIASANRFVNLGGKVEFFGICMPCEHVAFLIDSSGSMKGPRFERVKEELLKSLRGLKQSQRFSIYLFKSSTVYKRKNCVVSPT